MHLPRAFKPELDSREGFQENSWYVKEGTTLRKHKLILPPYCGDKALSHCLPTFTLFGKGRTGDTEPLGCERELKHEVVK